MMPWLKPLTYVDPGSGFIFGQASLALWGFF